jgi:hypothetical protein
MELPLPAMELLQAVRIIENPAADAESQRDLYRFIE